MKKNYTDSFCTITFVLLELFNSNEMPYAFNISDPNNPLVVKCNTFTVGSRLRTIYFSTEESLFAKRIAIFVGFLHKKT